MSIHNQKIQNQNNNRFGFLSGLPRTGSTLLTYILAQNSDIYVSGTSPIARLMLGIHQTCEGVAYEGLVRAKRMDFQDILLKEVSNLYYQNVNNLYILEKDRAWAYDPLGFLNYMTNNPKIIVMLRSVPEIMRSFVKVKIDNGDLLPERGMLVNGEDPFMDAYRSTLHALNSDDPRFLFATYDQLIHSPQRVLSSIYDHFGWKPYEHDFDNIVDLQLEDDKAFHTNGLHNVRSKVERKKNNIKISTKLMKQAKELDDILWAHVENSIKHTPDRHI